MPSCRRSDALAKELSGRSYLIHHLKFKRPAYAPVKYVLQAISSFQVLIRQQPDVVLVASPPVIAVLTVWFYAKICGIPFIIDAHTGVFDNRRWRWLLPLSRFLSRQATVTIVTNDYLSQEVQQWGGKVVVIGDIPVFFEAVVKISLGEGFHVVVINSFSDDEPLEEILDAAKRIDGVFLHVTGNLRYASSGVLQRNPPNVRFTGWLSDEDYTALLHAADAIMVLTTRDHTMQRGAYEAMALTKPLITSDWPLLRETFYLGTVHVSNRSQDIQRALLYTREQSTRLQTEMHKLKLERGKVFALKREELFQCISLNNQPVKQEEFISS